MKNCFLFLFGFFRRGSSIQSPFLIRRFSHPSAINASQTNTTVCGSRRCLPPAHGFSSRCPVSTALCGSRDNTIRYLAGKRIHVKVNGEDRFQGLSIWTIYFVPKTDCYVVKSHNFASSNGFDNGTIFFNIQHDPAHETSHCKDQEQFSSKDFHKTFARPVYVKPGNSFPHRQVERSRYGQFSGESCFFVGLLKNVGMTIGGLLPGRIDEIVTWHTYETVCRTRRKDIPKVEDEKVNGRPAMQSTTSRAGTTAMGT